MHVDWVAQESRLKGGREVSSGHEVDVAFACKDPENIQEIKEQMLGRRWQGINEALVGVHRTVGFGLISASVCWTGQSILERRVKLERDDRLLLEGGRKCDNAVQQMFLVPGTKGESGNGPADCSRNA